jgi:hypothetical protein
MAARLLLLFASLLLTLKIRLSPFAGAANPTQLAEVPQLTPLPAVEIQVRVLTPRAFMPVNARQAASTPRSAFDEVSPFLSHGFSKLLQCAFIFMISFSTDSSHIRQPRPAPLPERRRVPRFAEHSQPQSKPGQREGSERGGLGRKRRIPLVG